MDEIKSALELAMERAEKLGKASAEERIKWKYHPEGERLAVSYLKDEGNLLSDLSKFDEGARAYVAKGAEEVLIRNIDLPRNDVVKKTNKKAMDGIKILKKDKASLENAYSKIRRIFSHYEQEGKQQREQTYLRFKAEFEAKIQKSLQQQGNLPPGIKVDITKQPAFQEGWRQVLVQFDSQYYTLLEEYKQEISDIP